MEWCKHIHDWGNAWYFVSTYNPFAVRGLPGDETPERSFMLEEWEQCPICLTIAPDIKKKRTKSLVSVNRYKSALVVLNEYHDDGNEYGNESGWYGGLKGWLKERAAGIRRVKK